MRGTSVPELVGRDTRPIEPAGLRVLLEAYIDLCRGEAALHAGEHEGRIGEQAVPIPLKHFYSFMGERHDAVLVEVALLDERRAGIEVEILPGKPRRLACPEPGRVDKLE